MKFALSASSARSQLVIIVSLTLPQRSFMFYLSPVESLVH